MRWGLYPRLAVSLAVLLGVAMLTLGYVLLTDAEKTLKSERLTVAHTLARTLAEGSVDALAADDYELMERWVSSVLPKKGYAYAYLSRPDGIILTHTQLDKIGHHVDSVNPGATPPYDFTTRHKNRPVQETVYPVTVGNKHLANAHIAYYLDQGSLLDSEAAFRILGLLGLFLLLLLAATLLIIRRHTRPLSQLTEAITSVSLGAERVHKLDSGLLQRTDEIGALSREYGSMLERLDTAYEELRQEEQRLRERVDERTRELSQSYRELETFSYTVSHDLRAPLRAMAGFGQLLLDDYGSSIDEDGQHALQRICANAVRMDRLISDLLSLARVNRQTLQSTPVDLSAMAREILDELCKQQPERKVEIHIGDTPRVAGDPGLLRIALQNLLDNAWKYTGKQETAVIHFGVYHAEPDNFYLSDNGTGFDMRYVDKLFGVFQRLHSTEEFEGTGIGLATVERIIHRHTGTIYAESEPGKGATFIFKLPLAED